jgi:glutamate-5-semialdehyde dehydrogenase
MTTLDILKKAKAAAPSLAALDSDPKNAALLSMAQALEEKADTILAANALDMTAAKGKLSDAMLDRLSLTERNLPLTTFAIPPNLR